MNAIVSLLGPTASVERNYLHSGPGLVSDKHLPVVSEHICIVQTLAAEGKITMSSDKESVAGLSKDYADKRGEKIRAHVQNVLRKLIDRRKDAAKTN